MITSQTIRAPFVVKPHGRCTFYVVDRTQLLAQTTLDAGLLVDPELLIRDKMLVVITTNDVGKSERDSPLHQFFDITLTLGYDLADV